MGRRGHGCVINENSSGPLSTPFNRKRRGTADSHNLRDINESNEADEDFKQNCEFFLVCLKTAVETIVRSFLDLEIELNDSSHRNVFRLLDN